MVKHLFILLFFLCNTATAQTPFTKQVWLSEPEVAVNVNDLSYQPNGYLWIASDNGVYRYNGRTFTKINDSSTKICTAIYASKNQVWVGYKNGRIGLVKDNRIMEIRFKNEVPKTAITAIRSLHENILLITTADEGLFVSMNDHLLKIDTAKGLSENYINDIAFGKQSILLATDAGLNVLSINKTRLNVASFKMKDQLPDDIVTAISNVTQHEYWIGTQQGGIAIYNEAQKKIIPLHTTTVWTFGQVNDILAISNQEAWAITEEGYWLQLKRTKDSLITQPHACEVKLKKLSKDKTGNIWCATNKGLLMITSLYASQTLLPNTFRLSRYTAMACDDKNDLWFTQNNELYKLELSENSPPEKVLSLPTSITSLHYVPGNGLWIGTFGKGLYQFSLDNKLRSINEPSLNNGHILSIAHQNNIVWVASFNGLDQLKIAGNSINVINHYNKKDGIGSDYIYQLHADTSGKLWMATDGGGISMYDGNRFHRWDTTSGNKSKVFYSVVSNTGNTIWASSLDKGLYKFTNDRWTSMNQRQGLQDVNITAIEANGKQSLIVVNRNGIDQWYANDNQFRHFNRRLGIGIDSNSKMLNCIAKDHKGNVYAPFEKGIICFHALLPQTSIKPDICIRKLGLFFKDLPYGKSTFSHNENHLSFTYEGISFSNPERLRYRYKLEGYDDNWVYTMNEVIPFAQLNPGNYTFRIQVSLSDNFINSSEAQYEFTIMKPFWQTPLFFLTMLLILFSSIYLFVKWRERSITRMNLLQRERLVYEYEHLKSQVNPHFLFNSFNTLVNIIEEDKDAAIEYTVHLSDLYRNMLSYNGTDLIPLKEEYEIVMSYMHIQKSRFGTALQLHENIDQELLKTKKIVPMALQILLENAIKHNVVAASQPLHIYIETYKEEIIVRNNLQEKITKDKSTGIGIANIENRYSHLTHRPIFYGIENNEYLVKLPLL